MKKFLAMLLAMLLILTMFSGCAKTQTPQSTTASSSSQTTAPAASSASSTEKKYDPVTIKLLITGDTARAERYTKIFEKLKEEKNITVEVMLSTSAEMPSKYATEIAAGTAPDIGWFMDSFMLNFMSSGNLIDISAIKDDSAYNYSDIFPSVAELGQYNGKVFLVPFTAGARVIYFNKDLFKTAGLEDPLTLYKKGEWTWDKLFELSVKLTDKSKGIYGFSLFNYSDPKDWKVLYDYVWANGADFFSEDMTKATMNSPEMIKALQRYYDLIYKDGAHIKPGDQITFESGQVAMCRNQFSFTKSIQKVDFDWDIVPHPSGSVKDAPVATGTAGYAVLKGCKHVEEAIEAIKFITDAERQVELMDVFPPTRDSVLNADVFLNASQSKPTPEGRKAACIDSMKNLREFPSVNNMSDIFAKMKEIMDYLYAGSLTVEQTVEKMEKEVTPLLGK